MKNIVKSYPKSCVPRFQMHCSFCNRPLPARFQLFTAKCFREPIPYLTVAVLAEKQAGTSLHFRECRRISLQL